MDVKTESPEPDSISTLADFAAGAEAAKPQSRWEPASPPPKPQTPGGGGRRGPRTDEEQERKLFIGGLNYETTPESLYHFFAAFGPITDHVVVMDQASGRSRGFGFVVFAERASVDAAMAARPHVLDSKTVQAKRAMPKSVKGPESNTTVTKLYVSGIREAHTAEALRAYFEGFGVVRSVDVLRDPSGHPRGFAFVHFDDYDPVDRCVMLRSHEICGTRCDVKKGLSKEEVAKAQAKERDRALRDGRTRPSFDSNTGRGGGGGYGDNRHGRGSGGGGFHNTPRQQPQQSWGTQSPWASDAYTYPQPEPAYRQMGQWGDGYNQAVPAALFPQQQQQQQHVYAQTAGYGGGYGGSFAAGSASTNGDGWARRPSAQWAAAAPTYAQQAPFQGNYSASPASGTTANWGPRG